MFKLKLLGNSYYLAHQFENIHIFATKRYNRLNIFCTTTIHIKLTVLTVQCTYLPIQLKFLNKKTWFFRDIRFSTTNFHHKEHTDRYKQCRSPLSYWRDIPPALRALLIISHSVNLYWGISSQAWWPLFMRRPFSEPINHLFTQLQLKLKGSSAKEKFENQSL